MSSSPTESSSMGSGPASPTSFITTTCPRCGPTDIGIERVVLRVDELTARSVAAIHCPACDDRFTKRVDDAMSLLMATVGVEIQTISIDLGEGPAAGEGVGSFPITNAPITNAELDAFAAALASTDDIVAALVET